MFSFFIMARTLSTCRVRWRVFNLPCKLPGSKGMRGIIAFLSLLLALAGPSDAQETFDPIQAAKNGWSAEQDRSAAWYLAQHKKLDAAISALKPGKKGVIEAFVLSISLDSDPVFSREASEASRVLAYRYRAAGHTLLLTAGSDDSITGAPQGSPDNLAASLAAIASRMNADEDVLILFATTHGNPQIGLAYRDGAKGAGMIAPVRLAAMLDSVGIKRRMILISACYAGVFMPFLTSEHSVIVTAASSRRTSFGCAPGNDWTFFGDALINHALRKPQTFDKATEDALSLIQQWEAKNNLLSSDPQVFVGETANVWLAPLDAGIPKIATSPVGQPAINAMNSASIEAR
jgi:Peptidase C13 family